MAFDIKNLKKEILADNPTYERIVKSALHTLVANLSQIPKKWTAASVATEMKKIPSAKWTKYKKTRAYLEKEIPNLKNFLRAIPKDFKTAKMSSQLADTILRHEFKWVSDTGNMLDLAKVYTREKVTWPQWSKKLTDCIGLPHGAAYTRAGHHTGLAAGNPANTGKGQDDHALMGPFNQTILNFKGPAERASMDQVYEYSYDKVNWLPIPNSKFTIVREVKGLPNDKVQISITKTSVAKPNDKFVVKKIF